MSKETKSDKYRKNKRTYSFTEQNLMVLDQVGDLLISEKNLTKLVNFAIDQSLGTWLKTYEIEAKTQN